MIKFVRIAILSVAIIQSLATAAPQQLSIENGPSGTFEVS